MAPPIIEKLEPLLARLPEVKRPTKPIGLTERLKWTFLVLILYFLMGQIQPVGLSEVSAKYFQDIQVIFASQIGTIITAGIGPIVLASIILELLYGAKFLSFDFTNPRDRALFQGTQKLLAILFCFIEAAAYVVTGYISVSSDLFGMNVGSGVVALVVIAQIAFGSLLLIFLDEIVAKYGVGSGISLFIAAGVSQTVVYRALSPLPQPGTDVPIGAIPRAFYLIAAGYLEYAFWALLPLLFTVLIFLLVVYAEGIRVEIPLSYGRFGGGAARYPINFLYVSNIPVILAAALLMNIRLWASVLESSGFPLLGTFDEEGIPVSGLVYYLFPPRGYFTSPVAFQSLFNPGEILRVLVYMIFFITACAFFGKFWVETTGMDPKSIAEQLSRMGLHVPGFRRDPRMIERILAKYIPPITILGSIFVGFLAWLADFAGAIGTGTGILLAVDILYRFYQHLISMNILEFYPMLKKVVGGK